MPNDLKIELISRFESGYSRVEGLVAGIGPEELKFIPPVRDAWSINDFLVHLLDAEISLAFRVRAAIAEPGKAVPGWKEGDWHDALHYGEADGLACLAIAKSLRAFLSSSLRSVAGADWSDFFIQHPAKARLELGALVEMYERHVVFHLPLIKRNREAWLKKKG